MIRLGWAVAAALLWGSTLVPAAETDGTIPSAFEQGRFLWRASTPLVSPSQQGSNPPVSVEDPPVSVEDPPVSVKDPTVVYHDGCWHLFCTVRFAAGRVDIEYSSFPDWNAAQAADRYLLELHNQYYCAPQVFFFRPHERWYLIYQLADEAHEPPFGPCFSTSRTLADAKSWTKPEWMFQDKVRRKWLDFWVICDATHAHLFYTSLDGQMWHAKTPLADFPHGWSEPAVAIQGDIFEASHTYRLQGLDKYLTIVEAQGDRRRYYKAYLADRLDGPWRPLADTREKPFAAHGNVRQETEWTTNISHGELLRAGIDERLEVDPRNLRFLFQGASDQAYRGKPYGQIPWRLGLLELLGGD